MVIVLVASEFTVENLLVLSEGTFFILQSLSLLLDDLDLSIEYELLSFDFQGLLAQVLDLTVEVALHLCILRL